MITLNKQHRCYEKYRDSGVEWLGEIPSQWGSRRIGYLFRERREKVSDSDYPALSVTQDGIVPQLETAAKSDDGENRKRVCIGDFVINSRSDRKGSSGVSSLDGSVSLISTVLKGGGGMNHEYVHHLLRSHAFQEEFYRNGKGMVADLWTTNYASMRNIVLAVPTPSEQSSIASYLDEKCALIDSIIAKKQRQIELLKEKRAAIINRAVTRGLDENVEMKESGVEWIGEMPKNWEVKKLKTAFAFEKGKQSGMFTKEFVSDPLNEGEYPVYSGQTENEGVMGRINTYVYDIDTTIFTTTVGAKVMTPMIIGGKFSLSQNCVLFIRKSDKIDIRYFYFQLFPMFKWEKDSIPSHMQPSLRVSDLNKYSVAFPPFEEQVKIADHIEERTAFIDKVATNIEHSISLLSEYKTSLISHAVTGRIKVS